MKQKTTLTLILFLLFNLCVSAENCSVSIRNAIEKFYKEYYTATTECDSVFYTPRAQGLVRQYCTAAFVEEIEDEIKNGVGTDIVTGDYGDICIINTLEVTMSEDYYIVTFNVNMPRTDGGYDIKMVSLQVYTENGLICKVIEIKK